MKILLYSIHDQANIGIRMLGAYMRGQGHDCRLCFLGSEQGLRLPTSLSPGELSDLDRQQKDITLIVRPEGNVNLPVSPMDFSPPSVFLSLLRDWQPDIVGYSGRSILTPYFQDWFARIREAVPAALIIAVGFGPTLEPQIFLERGANAVVRGEGEGALAELADRLAKGVAWSDVKNLAFLKQGSLVVNPMRPAIRDLDALPMPLTLSKGSYLIRDDTLYEHDPFPLSPATVLLSRGCIGSCSYCSSGLWRDLYNACGASMPKYRYPSNNLYLAHLRVLKSIGATSFLIQDDFFIRPYDVMRDFFIRYRKEVGLPFTCNLHLPFIKRHPDILELALKAGLDRVVLPIQSADPAINKRVFNRESYLETVLDYAHMARSRFIPFFTHFIDGFFAEDIDQEAYLQTNLDFIKRLPSFHPGFPRLVTYVTSYLRLHLNSPLLRSGITRRMPYPDFFRRAMFMLFRHILSDDALATLRTTWQHRQPEPLLELYNSLLAERHKAYLVESAQRFAGCDVVIWGCGQLYDWRKPLLLGLRPRAFVADVPVPERRVDGVPVMQLSEWLAYGEHLPVFICIRDAIACARKLKALCPDYPEELIVGFGE